MGSGVQKQQLFSEKKEISTFIKYTITTYRLVLSTFFPPILQSSALFLWTSTFNK